MALFSKNDPLAAAVAARDKLRNRLMDTEAAVDVSIENRNSLALANADDTALDGAESQVRARVDRVETLRTGLAQSDALVMGLEAEAADAADKKTRHETADEIERMLRAGNAAAKRFDLAMEEMAAFAEWAVPFIPEAVGLQNYCIASRAQIPEAMTMIGKLAGQHAQAVLAKVAAATLRRPVAAPSPAVVASKAPVVRLFATRPVKFRNAEGALIVVQKFTDADFTPAAAMRGLTIKATVQLNDPLRRQYHGSVAGHPLTEHALDLDADPDHTPQIEPIQHSAFQPAKVGVPYTLKIAREG